MTSKFALVIANTDYQDASFAQLSAPGKDADEFAQVLRDLARFDGVQILFNEGEGKTRRSIARFFADRKHDDLLLLYFSGHGVRDEQGQLFLAASDTELSILDASGVPAEFVTAAMNNSRSQRQLLILDCCNSGAFAQGSKAASGVGKSMGIATAFEGSGFGRVVLTATDATQYAWEGEKVTGYTQKSLFTHFLIEGLKGDADLNGDGCIDIDELFDYVYDQVIRTTPKQTPGKWSYKQQGDIILRENLTPREVKPIPLPADVLELLSHPSSGVRKAGVQDLIALMQGSHPGLSRAAEEKLREIADIDDSLTIRRTARDELMARGVVLDKNTTEKFLKENIEAQTKVETSRTELISQRANADQPVKLQEPAPSSDGASARKGFTTKFTPRLISWIAGGALLIVILFFLVRPFPFSADVPTSTPTWRASPAATQPLLPVILNTSSPTISPTRTSILLTNTPAPAPATPTPWTGSTRTSKIDGMRQFYVPAGEFLMGSETGETNERPVHPVYLDAFWIDETEVTNKMYEKCVKDLACPQPSKTTHYSNPAYVEHPVVFVSWNGAEKYCKWAGRTLPTEAQWEKAARGENGRDYPWGSDPPDINRLNFASQVGDTRPANSYPDGASPYLVLNMAGNVAEWVADRMGDYKAGSTASKNPEGPARGNLRVVRGGAWQNYRDLVRSTYRVGYDPRQSYDYIGFRCAISAALEN